MATEQQIKARLRALSPEGRAALKDRLLAAREARGDATTTVEASPIDERAPVEGVDVPFEFKPEDPAGVIPRQLGNIPLDLATTGKTMLELIAEMVTEPAKEIMGEKGRDYLGLDAPRTPRLPLAISEMSRAFQGSGQAIMGEDGRNAQAARDAYSGFTDQLKPKFVAEHPVQAIQNILGAIGGAGRVLGVGNKGSTATQIAARAEGADPINLAIQGTGRGVSEAAKRTLPLVAKPLDVIVTEVLGVTTGMQGPNIREAFLAGFEGNFSVFRDFLKDRKGQKELLKTTNDALIRIRDEVDYEDRFQALNPAQKIIDIRGIKNEVKQAVYDFNGQLAVRDGKWVVQLNRGPSTIARKHRPTVKREVEDILNRPDKMRMRDLDAQKRELGDIQMKSAAGGKLISRVRQAVRDKLHEDAGYAELAGDYDKVMDLWGEASDALSLTPTDPKRVKGPAGQLKAAVAEGKDIEADTIARIETATGEPIRAGVSGLNLSQTPPKGLIGRAAIVGTAGTLAANLVGGLELGPSVASGVGLMAMTLPRTVGSIMSATGATAREAKKILQFSQQLEQEARRAGISTGGLTHAQVFDRIADKEEEPTAPSPLRVIGNLTSKGQE